MFSWPFMASVDLQDLIFIKSFKTCRRPVSLLVLLPEWQNMWCKFSDSRRLLSSVTYSHSPPCFLQSALCSYATFFLNAAENDGKHLFFCGVTSARSGLTTWEKKTIRHIKTSSSTWESLDTKFKSYDANKTDSFSRTKTNDALSSSWVTRFMTLRYKKCDSCVCVHSESHRRRETHQLEIQHSRSFI